jgi:hypothetical protein
MDPQNYTVAVINLDKVHALISSYAYIRNVAERSQITERYDNWAAGYEPSSLAVGENYNYLQLKRWVRQDTEATWRRFLEVTEEGPERAHAWLEGINRARGEYLSNFQRKIAETNLTNEQSQNYLNWSKRLAASAQALMEITLTWTGLLAGTAALSEAILLHKGWQLKSFMVAVGGGIAIALCDNWANAKKADLWVGTSATNTGMNLPSYLSSSFQQVLSFLAPFLSALSQRNLDKINQHLATLQLAIRKTKGSERRLLRLEKARRLEDYHRTQSVTPQEQMSKAGKALLRLSWGLVLFSTYQSLDKLARRWDQ